MHKGVHGNAQPRKRGVANAETTPRTQARQVLFCDDPLPEGRRSDMKFCRVREHAIQPSFTGESADLLRQAVGAQAEASSPDAPDEYARAGRTSTGTSTGRTPTTSRPSSRTEDGRSHARTPTTGGDGRPRSSRASTRSSRRARLAPGWASRQRAPPACSRNEHASDERVHRTAPRARYPSPAHRADTEHRGDPADPSLQPGRVHATHSPVFPDMRPVSPPGEHPSAAVRRLGSHSTCE